MTLKIFHLPVCATGWSLKTVDCNFLLTDPKISKSAITQWFLESSFREVLVFWCFKIVRYVKFCVLELFHSRAFAAPFTASTLLYTLRRIQTPQTYIHFTQMLSDTSFRYLGTLQDNNRHQQTPNNTNRRCQTPKKAVQGCVAVYVDINFRLLVSDDILYCLMLSADVRRVSKKFLKGYLGAAYWFVQGLNAYKGVWECSGLVLCSKYSILEKLQEANFHTPDSFETSKYQNLPIWAL